MENKVITKKIKCPYCGWEYLPGEIFCPNSVVGQPETVLRDQLGHILYDEYKEDQLPEMDETYVCDNCNKPFIATIKIIVDSRAQNEELDFSDTSVSLF